MTHTCELHNRKQPSQPSQVADDEPPTLAHGRYAGCHVEAVPEHLLQWYLAFDIAGHELRNAIRAHLNMRPER